MAAAITGCQRSNIGGVDGGVEMANEINRFLNSTHPPQDYSVRPPSLATKLSESPPLHRPPACLQPSPSSPSPPLHSATPYPPLFDYLLYLLPLSLLQCRLHLNMLEDS